VSETPIDIDKLRSLGYLSRGRTRDRVKEYRKDETGERTKETTDQLGNVVTQHAHGDRQDVTIHAPKVVLSTSVKEERE